jgi:hypothetical protein
MDKKLDNSNSIRRRSRPVTKSSIKTKIIRNKTFRFLVIFIVLILVLGSVYVVFSNFNINISDNGNISDNDDISNNVNNSDNIEENNSALSDEEKIIGTWKYSESYEEYTIIGVFTFFTDKTCRYSSRYVGGAETKLDGTWEIKNNKLILILEGVEPETTDYEFSNHDKTLTITDHTGYTRYLTKQ